MRAICFVAHLAYGAMTGGKDGHIGGVERQTSLMAKWLAARGHRVSILTWDEGQEDGIEIDGVRIFKMCRRNAGVPGLRFFCPRWSSLTGAMRRADADVYYQNCAEYVTGQVALWCRRHGRKFIYSVASDPDCDGRLPKMHSLRERVLYRYGLRHAAKIIVQTHRQQGMLQSNFGRDSIMVPMPCPGPTENDLAKGGREGNSSRRVLWIGRIYAVKRPDRLLDIAERCPDIQFDIVGQVADDEYARRVCERARNASNVVFHGAASRDRVPAFYRNAALLCCTSDFEGFPNTFLEAWSYGVPVVSTCDPDDVIVRKGLGLVGRGIPDLVNGIQRLLNSHEQRQRMARVAREYYLQNHTVDNAMEQFEQVFHDVVDAAK